MIFWKGERASLLEVLSLSQGFDSMSDLEINPEISLLLSYEFDHSKDLLQLSNFQRGSLPVGYHGLHSFQDG